MKYWNFCEKAMESLRTINCLSKKAFCQCSENFNLTEMQLSLMLYLQRARSANIGAIAAKFGSDCANISPMCKKMEKNELVRRCRSTEDERVVNVTLTEKGENTVNAILKKLDNIFAVAFAEFDDSDVEKILYYLDKFKNNFPNVSEEK